MPRPFFLSIVALSALWLPLSASGCGSGEEQMTCGPNGCSVCDGYGCRPADPGVGSTGGSSSDSGTSNCDPTTTTCPCGAGDTCTGDLQCMDGLCLVPCEFTSQCGVNRVCVNGKCVVGCDAQQPCEAGYVCGSKGICELDESSPQCSASKPCVGGLVCQDGVCVGACEANTDCAAKEICDASTGTCIPDPQPKAPCEEDPSVCTAAQTCVGGYCRYGCSVSGDCLLIDARIPVCDAGICKSEAEANPECLSKSDCPSGQDCVSNKCI